MRETRVALRTAGGFLALAALVAAAGEVESAELVLADPLDGATTGTRAGGEFAVGGWRVTGSRDSIRWHIPTVRKGAAEWKVRGLLPGECRPGLEDHGELFHMYDHTYAGSDTNYNPGYRDNPYKHFVRKQGCIDIAPDRMKIVLKIAEAYEEPGSAPISWDGAREYLFREEWGPDGGGNCVMRLFRDGALVTSATVPGEYAPAGHAVRIGASTRADAAAGAPLGAVFRDLKVWDLETTAPAVPVVLRPARGATVRSPLVFIEWRGASSDHYQVEVVTGGAPGQGVAWTSGEVASRDAFAFTGALASGGPYTVFVRVRNEAGLSPWSAAGHSFRVDPATPPVGPDRVEILGNVLADHGGPFLGLGVTYMSALRLAKHDRARLRSDLAFLAARGFRYVRVLSMVGWNASWKDLEIAPVSFTTQDGRAIAAWPDYRQQFRELIDTIAEHGLRAQVTIFADAQLMPEKAARIEHMRRLLEDLAGREEHVVLLEVGNEAWQNGFPGDQGNADLREFGRYLAERTPVLVALSAPPEASNAALTQLYAGSSADIATAHFTRDRGTPEGGWLPVRDCWGVELAAGLPPVSSNEPIGPGSSVSSENDPIKLVMAAAFAWGANLPMYVFHSGAGVRSLDRFEDMAGIGDLRHLARLLPPDLPAWPRNDGLEAAAPFTVFADAAANAYWPDRPGARTGAVRNTGKVKGKEFVTLPIGILPGGLDLEARRAVEFTVWNPLTGTAVLSLRRNARERSHLPAGPGAYIITGTFLDDGPPPPSAEECSLFETGEDGWVIDTWKAGPYEPGAGAWSAVGGNPGGHLLSRGSGASNNLDTCTREGTIITRTVPTSGLTGIHLEYDVTAALGPPPGLSGIGTCPVLGGDGADRLVVSYSTAGPGGPWRVAETLAEGTGLTGGWTRRRVGLETVAAAEDNPSFTLRFQWQFNAEADSGGIDNVCLRGAKTPEEPAFARADPNGDRRSDLSDAVFILNFLFAGTPAVLECEKSADTDDSGVLNITDAIRLLGHLFTGGPAPAPPYPACGLDSTADELACASHAPCGGA